MSIYLCLLISLTVAEDTNSILTRKRCCHLSDPVPSIRIPGVNKGRSNIISNFTIKGKVEFVIQCFTKFTMSLISWNIFVTVYFQFICIKILRDIYTVEYSEYLIDIMNDVDDWVCKSSLFLNTVFPRHFYSGTASYLIPSQEWCSQLPQWKCLYITNINSH